ncbi:MAG: ATP-dependent Clp protease proteolytic subunit [Dehalococcoidia bacterium]|nr:ATP-dependent Clp protease proteolytic subunit [Dehalococcoidia bacterium]
MNERLEDTVYFTFHDAINLESANRVMDFCAKAVLQYKPKRLYFLFSSGGGLVDSGVTLFNYLRGLPQEIIMHNVGSIDSIANAVFLAGDVRYATPISAFLLHGISWTFQQGAQLTYSQMQETISRFDAAEHLSAQIIGERSKLPEQEVRDLFRQGQSKDPKFALDKGLIHEIREVNIPMGAPLHSIIKAG